MDEVMVVPFVESRVEEEGWASLSTESITLYQVPVMANLEGRRKIPFYALMDPESVGYPDTVVVVSSKRPEGLMDKGTLASKARRRAFCPVADGKQLGADPQNR